MDDIYAYFNFDRGYLIVATGIVNSCHLPSVLAAAYDSFSLSDRIFRIWLFGGWFAESLASACSGVQHTWVIQLGGMVARVYDQSVDGVVLFEARLVALKLVKCCRPRENEGAVTYTATGVAFVVIIINLFLSEWERA